MQQIEAGTYHPSLPVFRFKSGANLTAAHFNKVLASLLSDICAQGGNTISCHSFRSGIPSLISTFPDLATSDLIKGWGRWKSECYTLYTRLQLCQRSNIFDKIATALKSVCQPLATGLPATPPPPSPLAPSRLCIFVCNYLPHPPPPPPPALTLTKVVHIPTQYVSSHPDMYCTYILIHSYIHISMYYMPSFSTTYVYQIPII